ncbi:MAG: TonB-dependent receptor, partial [Bacteroidales bacterium]|nr:TonB-dependent receptor [Bacteroidales bacterium]
NQELASRIGNNYKYYDSDASKFDGSAFVKATYALSDKLSAFGDIQYRRVHYKTDGYNDKYIDNKDGTASKHILDVDETYNFFNPKAGLTYTSGGHKMFASAAMSHREPERNNFTDNGKYPAPRAERLLDFEGGYQLDARGYRLGANVYYMRYKDQLVQTGEVSDIGEALTTNIPDSYRTGIELTAGADLASWLTLEANAALSRSRLLDFDEYAEDWDNGVRVIHYSGTALAFSPDAILNGFAILRFGGFKGTWHTAYVSRMYLDNTQNQQRSLPAYTLSNLSLEYTVLPGRFVKEIIFGVDFSNVFSAKVAQSGWVYSAICDSYGHPDENRYYQIGFVPVAPLTAIGHITLRF